MSDLIPEKILPEKKKTDTRLPEFLISPVRELRGFPLWKFKLEKALRRHLGFEGRKFIKVGERVRLQEALTMQFIAQNTHIPVPRLLDVFTIHGALHIVQERIKGPVLEDVWHRISQDDRCSAMRQLNDCLAELRRLPPPDTERVQAVDGTGLIDEGVREGVWGPFESHVEFHRFMNHDFLGAHSERYPRVQEALVQFGAKTHRSAFAHGDLGPHNAIWRDGRIVFIDWERSGWFPEYWDYTRLWVTRGVSMPHWWELFDEMADVRYEDELLFMMRYTEYFPPFGA